MVKRLFSLMAALLFTVGAVAMAWGGLDEVGPISGPHGFPLYYTDSNGLSLELCLDDDWCIFDAIDPDDSGQVALGVGGEVFWWLAEASTAVQGVAGGRAILTLALEGTFGGDEAVRNGQQISFGRVRVRVDVPEPGTYTVTHPFGTLTFENVTVADGINHTADIGATNFLDVEAGFAGALRSGVGPFLTWPDFRDNEDLQVAILDEFGEPTEQFIQYVGDPAILSEVVGSPGGNNLFRVEGPNGVIAETDLFSVMGREYDGRAAEAHIYPDQPEKNLALVGPVNREAGFNPLTVADLTREDFSGYPYGYPLWYEDENGVRLTICPPNNAMCIGDAVDPGNPDHVLLGTGGETFWWAADAFINTRASQDGLVQGIVPAGLDAQLILGLEGTFGGNEAIVDGNQISFGRVRIRIDTPAAGTYTVIHPYGVEVFENVPRGSRAINMTRDIGIADPSDPDYAFIGALYSDIGPNFLVWPEFDNRTEEFLADNPGYRTLLQPLDINDPAGLHVQYVGNPAIAHAVTGGTLVYEGETVNYFRILGPNGLDVRTNFFHVQGKVFDAETFQVLPNENAPVAVNDAFETPAGQAVSMNLLANDTLGGEQIDSAAATLTLILNPPGEAVGPFNGEVTGPDAGNLVTYTPDTNFSGTDTFAYTVTVDGLVSNTATVTITVLPPPATETVAVSRAQLDLRKLRWNVQGSGNVNGSRLTLRLGSATGTVIGTTTVSGGSWRLRATSTSAPPSQPVQIYVVSESGAIFGPFDVRVR
jgi:hypothetical protein